MNPSNERPRVYLVGELLQEVLANARRKLSGEEPNSSQVDRIARHLRRRRPPTPPDPAGAQPAEETPAPLEDFQDLFERIQEEAARENEKDEIRRRAEEARRMRDATDEKRTD